MRQNTKLTPCKTLITAILSAYLRDGTVRGIVLIVLLYRRSLRYKHSASDAGRANYMWKYVHIYIHLLKTCTCVTFRTSILARITNQSNNKLSETFRNKQFNLKLYCHHHHHLHHLIIMMVEIVYNSKHCHYHLMTMIEIVYTYFISNIFQFQFQFS